MSPKVIIAIVVALTCMPCLTATSQTYAELGMMSGSGLVLMPTNIVAPPAQFRIQMSRIGVPARDNRGMNLMLFSVGFSPIMEGYLRYTSEQTGNPPSLGSLAAGGKILMPWPVPLVRVLSLWMESSTSEMLGEGEITPSHITRGAFLATPFWNATFRPTFLFGVEKRSDRDASPMEGANLVVTGSQSIQLGVEYLHGYSYPSSHHVILSGMARIFPHVSVQFCPGYMSTPGVSGFFWTLGFSFNSADINFSMMNEEKPKDEYKLPTIEELEKSPGDDAKKPGQEEKQSDQEKQ